MQIIEILTVELFEIKSITDWKLIEHKLQEDWIIVDRYGAIILHHKDFDAASYPLKCYQPISPRELNDLDLSKLKLRQSGTAFSNAIAELISELSLWMKKKPM